MIYRTYRKGELPDIEIPRSDVLRPLMALCLRDGPLARALFSLVFAQVDDGGGCWGCMHAPRRGVARIP